MNPSSETLAAALEREHHEIDAGIAAYLHGDPADRTELNRALRALRRHIYLEEELLFPPVREAGLIAPIFVMLREHGRLWDSLDDIVLAPDAEVPQLCKVLNVQLEHHNLKEEQIIYPEADEVLSAPAAGQLRDFLDAGELPRDWIAQKAR